MLTADNAKAVAILAGLAVAGFVAYKLYKGVAVVGEAAKEIVTEKLNPVSDKNIAYNGVNSILQTLTGDQNATLGGKIYDWTH